MLVYPLRQGVNLGRLEHKAPMVFAGPSEYASESEAQKHANYNAAELGVHAAQYVLDH